MITLIDLHETCGESLHTLAGALDLLGLPQLRALTPAAAAPAGPIILVGTGPFERACVALKASGWWWDLPQLAALGRPVLGLGLGFHLLAEGSEEAPRSTGLGLLPGIVRALGPGVKIPHSGWTPVQQQREHALVPDPRGAWLYFRHAHALEATSLTLQTAVHGRVFSALEMRGQCLGVQAHLEKSGSFGLSFLGQLLTGLGEAPSKRVAEGFN